MDIRLDDLSHPKVIELLEAHLRSMQDNSPQDSVYALDLTGLKAPNISFWTAWHKEDLLGCGALKHLSATSGEIKSMRTHSDHLRKGVAAKLLERIIKTAKSRGYKSLSLETGSGPAFEPALTLYRKYGFHNGDAFGDYESSPFNQFLHLDI